MDLIISHLASKKFKTKLAGRLTQASLIFFQLSLILQLCFSVEILSNSGEPSPSVHVHLKCIICWRVQFIFSVGQSSVSVQVFSSISTIMMLHLRTCCLLSSGDLDDLQTSGGSTPLEADRTSTFRISLERITKQPQTVEFNKQVRVILA